MDSTTLYGYVPTSWIQFCFAVACLLTIFTTIHALFFKYPTFNLGLLIIVGVIFQTVGHVSMAISTHLPEDIPAWVIQLISFNMGRLVSRFAVAYVYGKMIDIVDPPACPAASSEKGQSSPKPCTGVWLSCIPIVLLPFYGLLLGNQIVKVIEPSHLGFIRNSSQGGGVAVASLALCFSVILTWILGATISETRKAVPWFRLTWMSGYYLCLMVVPVFLLAQDIFLLVKASLPDYHDEMMELVFDMGMTKAILMLLGCQTYEMATAWKESPPTGLKEVVTWWQTCYSRRGQDIVPASHSQEPGHNYTEKTGDDQV